MSLYVSESYKAILKELIAREKSKGQGNLTFQGMAEHCRIQKTYMSRVLNHEGDLTRDQLFLACEYLKLKKSETDFVLVLHDFETSVVRERKADLQRVLEAIRNKNLRTEKFTKVNDTPVDEKSATAYYLDPHYSVIHMLLTISKYRAQPKQIAELLKITPGRLSEYLSNLESSRIIEFKNGSYKVLKDNIHLPKESELQQAYRAMMRLKAIEKITDLNSGNHSFSVVFSSTPAIKRKIEAKFLEYIEGVQKLVESGNEEEVYQINFDLFGWS